MVVLAAVAVFAVPRPAAAVPGQVPVGGTPVVLRQPADPFLGKMTPSANADTAGMYSPQIDNSLVAIHAALLPSGRVISYGSPIGEARQGGLAYDNWNPAMGTGPGSHSQLPSMHAYDSFCNALEILPNGKLLMVGGNSATATMTYDPDSGAQTMGAALARQRWYASVLRLPDDRILVAGGGNYYNTKAYQAPDDNSAVATVPEIGTGTGTWTSLTGANSTVAFGARDNRWWYPRLSVAPDGKVFGVSYNQMWKLDPAGAGSVTALGTIPNPIGVSGSSVMYAPGKLLFAGGGQHFNETDQVATNAATTVDLNGATPAVASVAPMRYARNWLNLTVLSNGEVFANGGTRVGTQAGAANSLRQAELWSPTTGQWRPAATAQRTRTYHSVSLRLPGGSVLTSGGGLPGPENNFNSEIYYPPHLFSRNAAGAVQWASRPKINTISGSATYGGTLTLGMADTRQIASASLTSLGRVTHSYNTDQRHIPVPVTQQGASVRVTLPGGTSALPPGSYLLQGVDTAGVPTPSQIITIKRDGSAGEVTIHEADQSPTGTPGGTSQPGTRPLTPGTAISLEPTTLYGFRARHQNYAARVSVVNGGSPAVDRADATFQVRAGLANAACVSFESVNFPGRFLRHQNYELKLAATEATALFRTDATFCPRTGLTGQFTSFESVNFAGRYLQHRGGLIYLDTFDNTDAARKAVTWAVRPGLAG